MEIFVVERSVAKNIQILEFLFLDRVGTLFNLFLYLEVQLFLCTRNIWHMIRMIFQSNFSTLLQTTFGKKNKS